MPDSGARHTDATGRHEVAVIGDASMTLGFRLAGVKEYSSVGSKDQARFDSELSRMLESEGVSVVIAAQGMLSKIPPSLSKRMAAQLLPIVVGIPEKNQVGESGDSLRQLLKRSLGIEVKTGR